ncbi:hypothetical protein RAS12_16795 [Achromobacter seleniivolatilans]|uniref:Uncharacterized protein n=1 Tax=Achromobacter seleniivolatilans TaxID=3047478 RepID=A0ABY9LX73_9BURK|nr:hypothetical protein [Achromobacter sp. R39]WMD18302.1 hypothetical protein RAS12_16795 [Achromobacter sp. R39]
MQSLWNEQAVLIDADNVTLLSPERAAAARLSCRHEGNPAAAVTALLGTLSLRRPQWRNRLHVWLGYPWAHAQFLPWQANLPVGADHWRAYAQALLRERGITAELRMRLSPARHGRARLAFAADATLLDTLERQLREQGWRLGACRDLLSATLLRYGRRVRGPAGGLVLAEPTAMTCLWHSAQGWDDLVTLETPPCQSADAAIAAAEALCGRPATLAYGWASACSQQQLPPPPQAQWLGFPHPMLAVRSCAV